MSTDEKPNAEALAEQQRHLRDEIRIRNNRAAQEVRHAVDIVADELDRTAEKLKTSAPALATLRDEAALHGHLALLEAKDRIALLEDLVRGALAGAAASPAFIGETARLKLALARMDATDLFEEKRRKLREERRKFEATTEAALHDLRARVEDLAEDKAKKKK